MASTSTIYKSIKTNLALEYLQDMVVTGNQMEILGYSISSFSSELDPARTIDDINTTWYPLTGDYASFYIAPEHVKTKLTLVMQIPAGVTNQEVYMTEFYIFARYKGEIFLFGIGQTSVDPPDFKYISNTTYTQTIVYDLTQYPGNLNIIINQASGILAHVPLNLDSSANLTLQFDETLTIRKDTDLGVRPITNFIAEREGNASFTQNSITLPKMTLFTPIGLDSTNAVQSTVSYIDTKTYNIDFTQEPFVSHTSPTEYTLLYNSVKRDLHFAPMYSAHVNEPPENGEFNDVAYLNDNTMRTIESVAPNYTISSGVNVTEDGIVSNLGTLSMNLSTSLPSLPKFDLDFTTGDDISTEQSLFSTPYARGKIEDDKISVDLYSYAYEVEYKSVLYNGSYNLVDNYDLTICTLGDTPYYAKVNEIVVGTVFYTDTACTEYFGEVTSITEDEIVVSILEDLYTGSYTIEYSGAMYVYTLTNNGSTYYAKTPLALGSILYSDDTFQSRYGTVISINPDISDVTIQIYTGVAYLLVSSGDIYTYNIDGNAIYTDTPIADDVILYSDDIMTSIFGTAKNVDTDNKTLDIEVNDNYTLDKEYDIYITIEADGNTYYTNSALAVDSLLYVNSEFDTPFGIITALDSSNITISQYVIIYSGGYTSTSRAVYQYNLGSLTLYAREAILPTSVLFLDNTFTEPWGEVESVRSTSLTAHTITSAIGYVDTNSIELEVPSGLPIYSDVTLETYVEDSTGLNAYYTRNFFQSPLGQLELSILANTNYIGYLEASGTEYVLSLNSQENKIVTTRLPYVSSQVSVVLGGSNPFLGIYNLMGTSVEDVWEWNTHTATSPDWAPEPLCKLGSITVEDKAITNLILDTCCEVVKFTDLSSLSVNDSNYYRGQLIQTILPILDDSNVLLLNGAILDNGATKTQKSFMDYLMKLYNKGYTSFFLTEEEWQEQFNTYGICYKFVYNSTTGTIRVPYIVGIMSSVNTLADIGTITPAGLPDLNHTHSITCQKTGSHAHTRGDMEIKGSLAASETIYKSGFTPEAYGAFVRTHTNVVTGGNDSKNTRFDQDYWNFRASRSWTGKTSSEGAHTHSITINSSNFNTDIVGRSNTVQPQTGGVLTYMII